jgi:Tol biopolymer transport system component
MRLLVLLMALVAVAFSVRGLKPVRAAQMQTAERHWLVGDFDPSWTPNGKRVTFARSLHGEQPAIETIPLRGGTPTPVVGLRGGQPGWSRQGRLVFAAVGPTRPPGWPCDPLFGEASPCPQSEIFVASRHGTPRNLTRNPAEEGEPVWSPNGRKIAFMREVLSLSSGAVYDALFVMDADGAHVRQLTFGTPEPSSPTWTPDGRRIVYEQPDWQAGETQRYDLWSLNPRGGDTVRLTHTPRIDETDPSISPNGRAIAYSDGESIFIKPLHNGRPRRLTSGIDPAWSPNGRWIAFVHWRGEPMPGQIYVVRTSGGRARLLVPFATH